MSDRPPARRLPRHTQRTGEQGNRGTGGQGDRGDGGGRGAVPVGDRVPAAARRSPAGPLIYPSGQMLRYRERWVVRLCSSDPGAGHLTPTPEPAVGDRRLMRRPAPCAASSSEAPARSGGEGPETTTQHEDPLGLSDQNEGMVVFRCHPFQIVYKLLSKRMCSPWKCSTAS